jgi:hypothetical protein
MKVEDVPEELVEAAQEAMWAAGNKPRHMRAALAAVIPTIRRAALEEAAGVARDIALQWRHQVNTAATNSQRTTFVDRETGAMTALAAIRALDATPPAVAGSGQKEPSA